MKSLVLSFCIFIIISSGSCGLSDGDEFPPFEQYTGLYTKAFETSAFEPCGSTEIWWVISDVTSSRYIKCGVKYGEPAFANLVGIKSELGQYGHLGGYDREFRVIDVIEMRPPREGECD